MKAIISTVTDSGVPRIVLKPENMQDEAVLNSILNRNGDAVHPDAGYTIVEYEVNGSSYQSLTFGRNEDSNTGTSSGAITPLTGNGGTTYQTAQLIDKRITLVVIDSVPCVPEDYTSNPVTGIVVFAAPVPVGARIQILYRTIV